MSDSPLANFRFFLDGNEPLGASYDDEADVLYLWRGDEPAEGVGLTTDDGYVVRFNADTGDVIGFTILDYRARWIDKKVLEIALPQIGETENGDAGTKHRVLAEACA